jgi:hypothetical protein
MAASLSVFPAFAEPGVREPAEQQDLVMTRPSEILFIDPAVSDIGTILENLRADVCAVVLDARWPAARQMATALEGLTDIDAVHVIAHGSPGRVHFAGGSWSVGTLKDAADDFAAIGRAIA